MREIAMPPQSPRLLASLSNLSVQKALDPLVDIDLAQVPDPDMPWMSEALLSLYGTETYASLTDRQKLTLSQLEFSLFCSISCFGEKEVIANVAKLMLKTRFAAHREYIFHFIREENNHIYMFSEFCRRHGRLFPIIYSYAQGTLWRDEAISDLMTFVHVLVFEELGHGLNAIMMRDVGLPDVIRNINRYHVTDEGRHISFGRHLIREVAPSVLTRQTPEDLALLRRHIAGYIDSRHADFHNLKIYKAVGIEDAASVRDRLVVGRDVGYFARAKNTESRVRSMLKFLKEMGLIGGHKLLAEH